MKRILNSTTLAEKFGVSVRTIYRDIKALEQAGVLNSGENNVWITDVGLQQIFKFSHDGKY